MAISESSPEWVKDQVRQGLDIDTKLDIKVEIDNLKTETLINFFKENKDATFSKNESSNLKNGAAHIIAYQKALNLLGIAVDSDGIFGTKTQDALRSFQKEHGFKNPKGIPGPKTAQMIIDELNKKIQKPVVPTPEATQPPIPKPVQTPIPKPAEVTQPPKVAEETTENIKESPNLKKAEDFLINKEGFIKKADGIYIKGDLTITINDNIATGTMKDGSNLSKINLLIVGKVGEKLALATAQK